MSAGISRYLTLDGAKLRRVARQPSEGTLAGANLRLLQALS